MQVKDTSSNGGTDSAMAEHADDIFSCRLCPDVLGPPVTGVVPAARIFLMGQAPGPKEGELGRPFAWRAGRTLFDWFDSIGVGEREFRRQVYMGAVIRCFPGRQPGKGGDRKPTPAEIARCAPHFEREMELLRPELVLAVGKMAIEQFLKFRRLDEVVGEIIELSRNGHRFSCLPLPHPSGLSRWIQSTKGKALIRRALDNLSRHPVWRTTFQARQQAAER